MARLVPPNGMVAASVGSGSMGSPPGQATNVAAAAALTYVALTDSGGGTADGTVASAAAPVTITDSTGLDGTHNDTVAAITNTTALTDNGGGTADGTVAAQPTFAASVGWNGSSVYPSAADEAALTAIALAARNNLKEVTTELATQRTANSVMNQNVSDLAQKVIEIVTWMTTMQNNLKECTTVIAQLGVDLTEVRTQLNAEIAALKTANLQASS